MLSQVLFIERSSLRKLSMAVIFPKPWFWLSLVGFMIVISFSFVCSIILQMLYYRSAWINSSIYSCSTLAFVLVFSFFATVIESFRPCYVITVGSSLLTSDSILDVTSSFLFWVMKLYFFVVTAPVAVVLVTFPSTSFASSLIDIHWDDIVSYCLGVSYSWLSAAAALFCVCASLWLLWLEGLSYLTRFL